jgi:hypothetical protein
MKKKSFLLFKRIFLRFLLLCFLISVSAQAEKVVLVPGDSILGEITKTTGTSIIVAHPVLGELEIPKGQIESVIIVHDLLGEIKVLPDQIPSHIQDKPEVDTILLEGGDSVSGQITKVTDSSVTLVHKALGEFETPKSRIEGVIIAHHVFGEIKVLPGQVISLAAAEPKLQDQQETEERDDVWFEPEFKKLNAMAAKLQKGKWSFTADFSLDTTSGNQDEEATRLGIHIERNLPREILAVDSSYYHKISEGSVTDNKFTLGSLHDWLLPGSRWFYFVAGRFDYDEFESWEKRANVQTGPGYNLIKTDEVLFNLRLGAGGRKEWGSQNSDIKFEGLAGLDFRWKITEKQTFETSLWYFPVLTDFDDYRTRTTVNWRYRLAEELNLGLLVGLLHESQSVVDPGNENSDTRVYSGIQVKF